MGTSGKDVNALTYEAVQHLVNSSDAFHNWSPEQKRSFLQQLEVEVMQRQQETSPLTLKSVDELVGQSFRVQKYQRGYKWTPRQVRNLLDDIDGFSSDTIDSFYCLQPLVVSYRRSEPWELIDGQQRLTTIYLVLSYLNSPPFTLIYETRRSCTDFLESLPSRGIGGNQTWDNFIEVHGMEFDNVDNYHFFRAWQTIDEWFTVHTDKRESWRDKLLHQTKFIWYNVLAREEEKATDVFMRINSGKIALTNAELVKALFLKQANSWTDDFQREEIAREWDHFEQQLQDDTFWYFLTGKRGTAMPNRIELLFDVCSGRQDKTDDPLYTFNYFVMTKSSLEEEWKQIKRLFLQFKDWFEDGQLYHLIGFLVAAEIRSVGDLAKEKRSYSKTDFRQNLVNHIREEFADVILDNLRYGTDNVTIQRLLLLFNVVLSMDAVKFGNRFPFERYIKDRWSLEHIHAQHSQKLDDEAAANAFCALLKPLLMAADHEAFDDVESKNKLRKLTALLDDLDREPNKRSDTAKALIEKLRVDSFAYFGDNLTEAEKDSVDNLALLDRSANSSLNNAIFPEKRKRIRDLDRTGKFIPIGTKEVFMKYHSENVTQMSIWSKADREAYLDELKDALNPYLASSQT